MAKLWRGPTLEVKRGRPDPLWFTSIYDAKTVVKKDGAWLTVMTPQGDFLNECEVVLRGGFDIEISDELAVELSTAGFSQYISEL